MTSLESGYVPVLAAFEARFSSQLSPAAFDRTMEVLDVGVEHLLARQDSGPAQSYRLRDPGPVAEYVATDRGEALTLTSSALRLEVGLYRGLEHFRDLVAQVIGPLEAAGTVDRFSRLGLRKVEELTLPWAGRDAREWDGFVADALLAPLAVLPGVAGRERLTGRLIYEVNDGHRVTLSYGTSPRPMLRMSPARLRLPRRRTPGGVFMLDADSYFDFDVPASQMEAASAVLPLDQPISDLFDRCVTQNYRLFRMDQPSLFDSPGPEDEREGRA